jgi:hypothetical protein
MRYVARELDQIGWTRREHRFGGRPRAIRPVPRHPPVDGSQRRWIESIHLLTTRPPRAYKTDIPQDSQVLRDGGTGHPKGASQFADGALRLPQQVEDGSSGGIRDGPKHVDRRTSVIVEKRLSSSLVSPIGFPGITPRPVDAEPPLRD